MSTFNSTAKADVWDGHVIRPGTHLHDVNVTIIYPHTIQPLCDIFCHPPKLQGYERAEGFDSSYANSVRMEEEVHLVPTASGWFRVFREGHGYRYDQVGEKIPSDRLYEELDEAKEAALKAGGGDPVARPSIITCSDCGTVFDMDKLFEHQEQYFGPPCGYSPDSPICLSCHLGIEPDSKG